MTTLLSQEYPEPRNFELTVNGYRFYGVAPGDIKQALDWAVKMGLKHSTWAFERVETDLISGQADSFGTVMVEWL